MTAPGPRAGDPRVFQIALLACFLAFIMAFREFTLPPGALAAGLGATLATQLLASRALGLHDRGFRSALISALSLGLLLRTSSPLVAALAGVLAIGSKFVLRVRGKHVFNPTNFGILSVVLLTGRAWLSPAQWGEGAFLAFFIGALGLAVVRSARRLDVSLAFLGTHAALHLARILWLGQPLAVFQHRMSSGALILFAFFMISDPRSTPDARSGRIVFAVLVAAAAHALQFRAFVTSAPLWALLLVSPLSPVLDLLFPASRFDWRKHPAAAALSRAAVCAPGGPGRRDPRRFSEKLRREPAARHSTRIRPFRLLARP